MLAGTPGFQPPEQLRSEALGIAADVYAFGGVLVVLFGEKPLWPGLSSLSLREAVLRMTCIAIAYPNPDIPAQPAVGVAIAVLNKMVDDTDNQKKV